MKQNRTILLFIKYPNFWRNVNIYIVLSKVIIFLRINVFMYDKKNNYTNLLQTRLFTDI